MTPSGPAAQSSPVSGAHNIVKFPGLGYRAPARAAGTSTGGQDLLLDQAAPQRELIRSISDPGRDRGGIGVLMFGSIRLAVVPTAEPAPMAVRMQPAMPRYARGEKAPGVG